MILGNNKTFLSCLCATLLLITTSTQANHESKSLRLAIGEEPTEGFDPMLGWSHGSYLLLHSPLLKQQADLSWDSNLLENYSQSDDGLTWILTLKPDLKFSNGLPLAAIDVVFTFNNIAQRGGKIDMGNFKIAEEIDPTTVKITLNSPQSTFIYVLGSLGIVCAQEYNEKTYAKKPIGAGPYRLVSYQPGQQLVVEANPYYAGQANDFERLIFVFLNEDIAYAAAQSGQLDIVRIPTSMAASSGQINNLKLIERTSVENRGISFPTIQAGTPTAQGANIGNDITADVAIRKAINYVINRQRLADMVFNGYATPAYTGVQGLPWNDSQGDFIDNNPQEAIKILEQSGWILNKNGVREKNGIEAKLNLWYASGDSGRKDLALAIRSDLKSVGIELNPLSASWETIEKKMHSEPVLFGWGSLDPMELTHYYNSQSAGVGYYNPGYYSNSTVDAYQQQALNAHSQQEAIKYWQLSNWDGKTGSGLRGDAAWAWLLNIQHTYLVNPCVDLGRDVAPEIHGAWSLLNNLDDWAWTCQ